MASTNNDFYNMIMADYINAKTAEANRPQKTSTITSTMESTRPYEYEDMRMRRDTLGATRNALADALKQRENFGYSLASALSALPAQQGAGSWASDLARSFGGAFNARANAAIDRAQRDYDTAQNDLATALAYDKAMGSVANQVQQQQIGYDALAGGGSAGGAGLAKIESSPIIDPREWDYMITNFDNDRPTEADYRNMSEKARDIHNWRVGLGWGNAEETLARQTFNINKGKNFLPMAREALKGTGQITDFEDKKYTQWLNEAKDPVQLKDVMVKIVRDVATLNGWTPEQRAEGLRMLGLQSESGTLPRDVEQTFPEQVAGSEWKTLSNGMKIRLKK